MDSIDGQCFQRCGVVSQGCDCEQVCLGVSLYLRFWPGLILWLSTCSSTRLHVIAVTTRGVTGTVGVIFTVILAMNDDDDTPTLTLESL